MSQTVGLTDISVNYSSPGQKGRTIWGELVPYGKVWRTGANSPTRIVLSRAAVIGESKVPAGTYTLMTFPGETQWDVIFSRDPENKGAAGYDKAHDVARVRVPVRDAPRRERMAILFEDTTDESTQLVVDWAGKRVAVPITVDTDAHARAAIEKTFELSWRPLFNIGRYYANQGRHQDALTTLEQSIDVTPTFWNHWFAARSAHEIGDHQRARAHAVKAAELGTGDPTFERAFKADVDEALAEWPKD